MPQTYFKEASCYIWSVRLPLRNDMNFASIKNTYDDSSCDYFKMNPSITSVLLYTIFVIASHRSASSLEDDSALAQATQETIRRLSSNTDTEDEERQEESRTEEEDEEGVVKTPQGREAVAAMDEVEVDQEEEEEEEEMDLDEDDFDEDNFIAPTQPTQLGRIRKG